MNDTTNTMKYNPAGDEAWYRQFYVWLIIFLPACAIVASFATLYIAAKNPPELAVDDYSNIESIVAKNAALDNAASVLGLNAEITFGSETDAGTPVSVLVRASEASTPLPDSIKLRAVHSTQSARDTQQELTGVGGTYEGIVRLPPGRYELLLEDSEGVWRLRTAVAGRPSILRLQATGVATQGSGLSRGN